MSTTSKEIEKISTEGDQIWIPTRCASKIVPPKAKWNPFTEILTFYDPELHQDMAFILKDAPIQSREHEEEKEEEIKSFQ